MIYLLSFLACLGLSYCLEPLFKPYFASFLKRHVRGVLIAINLVFITQALFLLITHRPVFSALLTLGVVGLLLVVNNAKYLALREPLVFSDFFLYLQAIHFPRLYFPFLGLPALIILPVAFLVVVYLGFTLEDSAFEHPITSTLFLMGLLCMAIFALLKLASGAVISGDLEADIKSYGVLSVLCIYAKLATQQREELERRLLRQSCFNPAAELSIPENQQSTLPDIIVIQSESFFDARSVTENIKKEVLQRYDEHAASFTQHGALTVPAWGANTMRSEFAFLTAYTPKVLGLARFYPYQQLLTLERPPSLITYLKQLGYHCVCIHPHDATFFVRDRFFEKLGFDEFIDESAFESPERIGPYISDADVLKKIIATTQQHDDRPLFIFAITMENHGPLHLEAVEQDEWKHYFETKPAVAKDDLTVYLRHLKNADLMIDQLIGYYKQSQRRVGLAFYGDHVPSISETFHEYGFTDDRSNYFIWNNFSDEGSAEKQAIQPLNKAVDINIESLALTLLSSLKLSPYDRNKS